jgi:superfamily I DNA/RNA helicase
MGWVGYREDIENRYYNDSDIGIRDFAFSVIPGNSDPDGGFSKEIKSIIGEYKVLIELSDKHGLESEKDKFPACKKILEKIKIIREIVSKENLKEIKDVLKKESDEYLDFQNNSEIVWYLKRLFFKVIFLSAIRNNRYDLKNIDKIELTEEQKKLVNDNLRGHFRVTGPSGTGKTLILVKRAVRLAKENSKKQIRIFVINESLKKNIEKLCEIAAGEQLSNLHCHSFYRFFRELCEVCGVNPKHFKFLDENRAKLVESGKNKSVYLETIEDPYGYKNTYKSWEEFLRARKVYLNDYPAKEWVKKHGLEKIRTDIEQIDNNNKYSQDDLYKIWLSIVFLEWEKMKKDTKWSEFLDLTDNLSYFNFEKILYEYLYKKIKSDLGVEKFMEEEVYYLRTFLSYKDYVETERRWGRKYPLNTAQRMMMVYLAEDWHDWLKVGEISDEPMIAKCLTNHLTEENIKKIKSKFKIDYVFIDEVQDVPTLNIKIILDLITNREANNALFFTGDLQQKIKFTHLKFSHLGLNFQNRYKILKKNYRNTRFILESAKKIVEKYKIPNDEDLEIINPEFSNINGVKPVVIDVGKINKTINASHEDIICENVRVRLDLLNSIAVVSENNKLLKNLSEKLKSYGIKYQKVLPNEWEHQDFSQKEHVQVFISDMASVKGYEFDCVILADISAESFPARAKDDEELWRDAAKFYVAMTRARDELVFTYEGEPSFFIEDIKETLNFI